MSPMLKLAQGLTNNRVWRSVFRNDYPRDALTRSQVMVNSVFLHIHPVKVRRHTLKISYTWGLGIIAFWLFLILGFTGLLLMFFYVPSVERAYSDIQDLQTQVDFGMLLRNLHRWSAHLMVLVVVLHMCRIFYTGGYKPPREFNWVVGVMLLVLTLLLSFTGYLLPWDQLSFWAITVGTNIAGYAPIIGEQLRFVLLGAKEVGQEALLRFYALHIAVLSPAMIVLLAVHFWRIRKDGGLSAPVGPQDGLVEEETLADYVTLDRREGLP